MANKGAESKKVLISKKTTTMIGRRIGINFDIVSEDTWNKAINVEMEHSRSAEKDRQDSQSRPKTHARTAVIGNSPALAGKIALAHLLEFPDYYERLERMEHEADEYWKGRERPSVLIKK